MSAWEAHRAGLKHGLTCASSSGRLDDALLRAADFVGRVGLGVRSGSSIAR